MYELNVLKTPFTLSTILISFKTERMIRIFFLQFHHFSEKNFVLPQ